MSKKKKPKSVPRGTKREFVRGLLVPGEELVIVSGDKPVAKLVRESNSSNACQAGSAKDTEHWMADDFDEPLADFAEYSE